MKKRIIALFLVVIMTVLTLASCGSYNLAKEDLTKYTDGKFDVEKFVKALQNLEIEDEEYTTNEATQKKVVAAAIYDAVASGIISEATASNGYFADDKLTSGKIGKNDVVYYCYYFSVDTDKDPATPDEYFSYAQMNESKVTSGTSAEKAKHFIKLGSYLEGDKFSQLIKEKLTGAEFDKYYSTSSEAVKVNLGDNVVVSYDLVVTTIEGYAAYKAALDAKADAEDELAGAKAELKVKETALNEAKKAYEEAAEADKAAKKDLLDSAQKAYDDVKADVTAKETVFNEKKEAFDKVNKSAESKQKANYELIKVEDGSSDRLVKALADVIAKRTEDEEANKDKDGFVSLYKVDVASQVAIKDGNSTTGVISIVEKNDEKDTQSTYKYENVKVEYLVKDGLDSEISFEYEVESDSEFTSEVHNGLHATDAKSTKFEKGSKITVHVYPVFRLAVPETITAELVLQYAYGSNISTIVGGTTSKLSFGTDIATALNELLTDKDYKYMQGENEKDLIYAVKNLEKLYKKNFTKDTPLYNEKEALNDLDEKLTEVEKAEKSLKTASENAKKAYDALKKKFDDASKAVTDAAKALTDAQNAYDTALAAYEAAQKAYDEAAEADKADLKVALDNAIKARDEKNKAVENATDAKTKADNAKKALDDAITAPKEAYEKAVTALDEAKKAYEAAAEADKEAKKKALEDAEKALETAKTNLAKVDPDTAKTVSEETKADYEAKIEECDKLTEEYKAAEKALEKNTRTEIALQISLLSKAKKKDTDEKNFGEVLFAKLDEELHHEKKDAYNTAINKKITTKVYEIIDEMVKVTSYPEKLEKEFYEHLYDTYENKFYTGTYQPTGSTQTSAEVQSNYLHYKGDINAYLVETLKITDASKIEETIMKEVHAEIEPLIKIFVVAQALNEYQFKYDGKTMDAAKLLETFTAEDIKAGIYDSEYEYDENLSEKENKKAEKQFKKEMEKSLKNVEKDSAFFLVDNKALRNYKKSVGNKQYRQIIKAYGETNIRAILQTNKLFGLLTAAERVVVDKEDHDHTHTEFVYTERDGVKYIDYKIIRYTTTDK